jgi:hypothetical protein
VYPNGVSISWLSILDCPFVFVRRLVYPMVSVSLDCLLLIVPLTSFCVLCAQWCQCLWIVRSGFSNVYLTRKIGTFSLNLTLFSSFFCFGLASMKIVRYDHMHFASFTLFWVFFVLRQFDDIVYFQNKNMVSNPQKFNGRFLTDIHNRKHGGFLRLQVHNCAFNFFCS